MFHSVFIITSSFFFQVIVVTFWYCLVGMRTFSICLYLTVVLGVDRNNFKKCADSSFCDRRRVFSGAENENYKIKSQNLLHDGTVLQLDLEAEGRPCLTALHTLLNGGSARIVIQECQPYKVT